MGWLKAKNHIKCEMCELTVGDTYDSIGDTWNEDNIYDHIEKICEKTELYNQHEIIQRPPEDKGRKFYMQAVDPAAELKRSEHVQRWQTHAMKELCDNLIQPNDDEIKDSFLTGRKKKQSKAQVVDGACERI